jgi:colanic acid biosynthesis glycosyl transferase WcaI
MRILLLNQWFHPEPSVKGLPFARALRDLGHEVEVVTGVPNYPDGHVYPGYRVRPYARETMDGIPINRMPLYPSHNRSAIGRATNYISFALSAAVGVLLAKRSDVAYVFHPPATIAFPAIVLKLLRGVPFVLDIQDLWPDTVAATGMVGSPRALALLRWFCAIGYQQAARIVVPSHGFKAALQARGVSADKIDVILNWCDEPALLRGEPTPPRSADGRFEVVFAGTMGAAQGLDAVLGAATILLGSAPRVRFTFIGGGIDVDRLRARVTAESLTNVRFVERQSMEKISGFLSSADALLVHLKDDPLFRITIPSKTQAYMALGKPIVMAVAGDAATLVNDARCGITCVPGSPESIAGAVLQLAALTQDERFEIGRNGARFYQQQLSMAVGVREFEGVLRETAARTWRRPVMNTR